MNPAAAPTLAAALVLGLGTAAQGPVEWTEQELVERYGSATDLGWPQRLARIADLVAHAEQASAAVNSKVHGRHREYMLEVQRLVDQLDDERWLAREQAERSLVEIGSRARPMLEDLAAHGEPLEVRIRSRRILAAIAERGTEDEERETRLLRLLVEASSYLPPGDARRQALRSALGHADGDVRVRALASLVTMAEASDLALFERWLAEGHGPIRAVALAGIAHTPGEAARQRCAELLDPASELDASERYRLLRQVRRRDDVAAIRAHIDDPLLAEAAALALPGDGEPATVRISTLDRHAISGRLVGLAPYGLRIAGVVDGLPEVRVPEHEIALVDFPENAPVPVRQTRLFLSQGTLLSGELLGLDADAVRFRSPVFGEFTVPRGLVQGLAVDPNVDRLLGASTRHDRMRRRDGSVVDGEVTGFAGGAITVQPLADGADPVTTPLAEVAGVLFQRPAVPASDPTRYTRIDMAQGDRFLAHLVDLDGRHAAIAVDLLGTAIVPTAAIARLEFNVGGGALWGFTIIADYSDNRIIELDDKGRIVYEKSDLFGAWDVECLDNGNLLITEFAVSQVKEVTRDGEVVWSYSDLKNPYDADRLPNGNTLIADSFGGRVIEVSPAGEVVWTYDDSIKPFDADRLANGNTLIADILADRVIEVDPAGVIVWQVANMAGVYDADRLPNGNTLITLRTLNKVVEVDPNGRVVFTLTDLNSPSDADRLPNGHTLVAENTMVREFDRTGQEVWRKELTWAVEVNRY